MTCLIPGGYVDESGAVHRDVVLNPLSGREEELVADRGNRISAGSITTILSHCIQRIGNIYPVSESMVRSFLVADRQYLLLKLREVTFGNQIQATIICPWEGCRKLVDIDFSISDIPVVESKDKGPIYRMELSSQAELKLDNQETYRDLSFRLPNGEDQEVISPLVPENEAEASILLLERCIQSIGPIKMPKRKIVEKLSPVARMEIESQMEEVAPKVYLEMDIPCSECGREFSMPFDLQSFFFNELRISLDLLYHEVHYLAYHYHWSEREIMDMPRAKRRRYIEILADEIERINYGIE